MDVVALSFAALERARSVRDSHFEPWLPWSCTPLSEYQRNVLTVNAAFVQQCLDSRVRYFLADKHVCMPGCARVQHKDAFVCRRKGNLHYCDASRCDERREYSMDQGSVTMYTEDTCFFTGKTYGTIFEEQLDDRQGSMSQFIVEKIKVKKPKPVKSTAPRVRSRTGIKGRKLAKHTIEKQQSQPLLRSQARNWLLSMLPKATVPDSLVNRFADTCVRLWVKVHDKAEKIYRAIKYHFQYHCYVVMYYMQEGFSVDGLFLLPREDFLTRNLPNMREFAKFNVKTKWHTKCSRQFLVAVRSLGPVELAELSNQLRAVWDVP